MYPDFEALQSALNDQKVRHLVVGGYAVSEHAEPGATNDLDIFVEVTKRNLTLLFRALQEFGAPLSGYSAEKLVAKGAFLRMGHAPVAIDILSEIDGVSFRAAWKEKVTRLVNQDTGLAAHFISLDDLIANKLSSARSRDLADVEALRAVKHKKKPSAGRKDLSIRRTSKRSPSERRTKSGKQQHD